MGCGASGPNRPTTAEKYLNDIRSTNIGQETSDGHSSAHLSHRLTEKQSKFAKENERASLSTLNEKTEYTTNSYQSTNIQPEDTMLTREMKLLFHNNALNAEIRLFGETLK